MKVWTVFYFSGAFVKKYAFFRTAQKYFQGKSGTDIKCITWAEQTCPWLMEKQMVSCSGSSYSAQEKPAAHRVAHIQISKYIFCAKWRLLIVFFNNYLGKYWISNGHPVGLDHWIRTRKEEPRYSKVSFFQLFARCIVTLFSRERIPQVLYCCQRYQVTNIWDLYSLETCFMK